jgi:hypothetical protein
VSVLVSGGRCRWIIGNECFNTLKNQGYHLEHNYGHGETFLSFNMYLLTVLAFFLHQIQELTDPLSVTAEPKLHVFGRFENASFSYLFLLFFCF